MLNEIVFLILGIVAIIGLHWYIRNGRYTNSPVDKDGELWYQTPVWLRLPLLVFYGFTSVIFLMYLDGGFRVPNQTVLTLVSILLTLSLYILEPKTLPYRGGIQRKRGTVVAGFVLGITLAFLVAELV